MRPCCCTSCCAALILTRQGESVRLLPATLALLGPSAFAGGHRCCIDDLNRQIQVLTSGQNGGKLDEWAHCSSWPVSWSALLSTAPGRLALGGSHSGPLGRQCVTSEILPGVTLAVQCCMLLERSSSSSLFSSFSSRPLSPTSGACGLPAGRSVVRLLARRAGSSAPVGNV